MSINDLHTPICDDKAIKPLYNKIMSVLSTIDTLVDKSLESNIFKISGSAPERGWITTFMPHTRDKTFLSNDIGKAVHNEDSITNFELCAAHYRDIYVWHAWLKINEPDVRFKYTVVNKSSPRIIIPYIYESINKKQIEGLKENFYNSFNSFHKTYPIIGLLHRCLIICRYIENKDLLPDNAGKLLCYYYPLFYSINLFIHICLDFEKNLFEPPSRKLVRKEKNKIQTQQNNFLKGVPPPHLNSIYNNLSDILKDMLVFLQEILEHLTFDGDRINKIYVYDIKNINDEHTVMAERRAKVLSKRQHNQKKTLTIKSSNQGTLSQTNRRNRTQLNTNFTITPNTNRTAKSKITPRVKSRNISAMNQIESIFSFLNNTNSTITPNTNRTAKTKAPFYKTINRTAKTNSKLSAIKQKELLQIVKDLGYNNPQDEPMIKKYIKQGYNTPETLLNQILRHEL